MATLVTGGTGFVGANIVKDLARNGHQVVSLDINGPDGLLQAFLGDSPTLTVVQVDIVERASGEGRGQDCSIVPGGSHHPGAEMETCPKGSEQIMKCGCVPSRLDPIFR